MSENLIPDPRDNERLWELLRPLMKRSYALRDTLPICVYTMATMPDSASEGFDRKLDALRNAVTELEKIRAEALAIRAAFVPEFDMVPLTANRKLV